MKKTNIIVLFSLSFLLSCGSDDKKQPNNKVYPVSSLKPAPQKQLDPIPSKIVVAIDSRNNSPLKKKEAFTVTKPILTPEIPVAKISTTEKAPIPIKKEENDLLNFVNLRKIFSGTKIGQTMSQKDLTQNFKIPEEAVKLVKSVTRTAHDELNVKWRSTWLVEKVSDAELEDGKMKVRFQADKMFMSGKAIGIKYNRKVYNDLIIIGHSAYIPSVKGYHWQIGK
ncbi:hypothetical protein SAMN05444397_106269 [Flavobacterium aquidurense]|uniref:Lipoprotein n=1 Tax=Flavobacterium frigidimaris TaxID=262320 RepID=A0ABX4BRZ5_FLAFR|nr:hypothetical protein [Flavobacterium frigidimaris]OXA80023.1 hypothetical protein B0A65_08785 [Flavobacterium frigidimaris]SDZ41955.1 hypothetical protein SAMN05444397_106269 [Flavobacterium aquidurense]